MSNEMYFGFLCGAITFGWLLPAIGKFKKNGAESDIYKVRKAFTDSKKAK